MDHWLRELDEVLRGAKTTRARLSAGTVHIRTLPLVAFILVFGAVYGLSMGLYAGLSGAPSSPHQLLASTVKLPALFILTLGITFPSLYVFSALRGVPMGPGPTLKIVLVPLAVTLTVLASLGPVAAFFTLSTDSYLFMKALHAAFFAVSGVVGVKLLSRALRNMEPEGPVQLVRGLPVPPEPRLQNTFAVWSLLFAFVGAQMGWILRPLLGAPGEDFAWFMPREGSIVQDLLRTVGALFS